MTECPLAAEHTTAPSGYLAWHAWADEMSRTHRLTPCPGCNRFAVWVPRTRLARARCPVCAVVLAVRPPAKGDRSIDVYPRHPRRARPPCPGSRRAVARADYTETV